MDKSTGHGENRETQQPKDEENNSNSPEHFRYLSLGSLELVLQG
jgi:hypothetical protein